MLPYDRAASPFLFFQEICVCACCSKHFLANDGGKMLVVAIRYLRIMCPSLLRVLIVNIHLLDGRNSILLNVWKDCSSRNNFLSINGVLKLTGHFKDLKFDFLLKW